jgi:hemerythrin-like metal-binding protein/PAS domain S-box-containing protein
MDKIDIIPWNDNFNTGIASIDKQHKKLVDIINELATQFAYNSNNIDINNIFDELIDYTNYHFDSEEFIWNKYFNNQKSEEEHKHTHKSFIGNLHKLIEKEKNSSIEEIAENVLEFLVQWLVSHILESDRFMAYKVLALKEGKTYEEAHSIALEKMSGSTKKLTNLVMDMYKVLSTNTLKLMRESAKQLKTKIELENEKTKYLKLMTLSSDMIFIMDLKGNLLEYSYQTKKNLGYSDEEMQNLKLYDWDKNISPEENEKILQIVSDKPFKFEAIHTRKDGSTFDVEISVVKIEIENQDYIYASARDISQRIENEKLIKSQKDEFETIFNYAKDAIVITDLDTNFLNFNQSFLDMTGFSKSELLKKNYNDITISEHKDRNNHALEQVLNHGYSKDFEEDCIVSGNRIITVSIRMSLLPDKKRILLTLKNISNLKIMEQQARLASMGEMIGNIAHQWRQPLSVITTSASGLKLESEFGIITKEYIDECVDNIMKQSNYLSNTIDNFRNFIKGENIIQEFFLSEVIKISLDLITPSLKHNYINLILDIEEDGKIYGNKNELSEALINILNNAKDVLKHKIKKEEDRLLLISTKKIESDKIQLSILDSGEGISEKIINKIFDPYFTTKHEYQGTGLGLSMSENIIRNRHKGSIVAFNKQFEYNEKTYKGACFDITFDLVN